jgi:proteasome lid subunit RPN8/RPN11
MRLVSAALRIPRTIVNQILHQAQQAQSEEICGLIGGRDGELLRCYPVANVAGDKRHLFQMDPRGQIDAMRQMRAAGDTLLAIYHSHPDAPALPSAIDIAQDEYPEALYLIVSLTTKGVLEMRGFRIRAGRAEEVAIAI